MILIINTVLPSKIFVALVKGDKFYKKINSEARSDKLLILIDKILKGGRLKPQAISGIIVVSGPGSFTAVRGGAVVANTLGFALRIPVAGVRLEEFQNEKELLLQGVARIKKSRTGTLILPFYDKEPNITIQKRKI